MGLRHADGGHGPGDEQADLMFRRGRILGDAAAALLVVITPVIGPGIVLAVAILTTDTPAWGRPWQAALGFAAFAIWVGLWLLALKHRLPSNDPSGSWRRKCLKAGPLVLVLTGLNFLRFLQ
ncbi:MAG: hypothetical protein EON90_02730 [Brevundimonas sp.]|nr:MAG: hypothetical protein EON90_02730 [Brevundimonas sp.]